MAKRKAATVDIEFIKHSLGISGFGFAGIQMSSGKTTIAQIASGTAMRTSHHNIDQG